MTEQTFVAVPLTDDTLLELTSLDRTVLDTLRAETRVANALAATPGWPGINDPALVAQLARVAVAATEAR